MFEGRSSILFIFGIISVLYGLFAVILGIWKIFLESLEEKMLQKHSDKTMLLSIRGALFKGSFLEGICRRPASGVLILFKEGLSFQSLIPGLNLWIPMEQISAARMQEQFLGINHEFPVMVIKYSKNPQKEDFAGWRISQNSGFIEAVTAQIGRAKKPLNNEQE